MPGAQTPLPPQRPPPQGDVVVAVLETLTVRQRRDDRRFSTRVVGRAVLAESASPLVPSPYLSIVGRADRLWL